MVKPLTAERPPLCAAPCVWTCPKRPQLPQFDATYNQWDIGYAFFGGLTNWYPLNTTVAIQGHSPVKLGSSKPYWCLAADANVKVGSQWAGVADTPADPRYFVYQYIPPHQSGAGPAGGNEVFADGSGTWCKFTTMHHFAQWNGTLGVPLVYWYQDPSDFNAQLNALLPAAL